jgi:hypothetical protein
VGLDILLGLKRLLHGIIHTSTALSYLVEEKAPKILVFTTKAQNGVYGDP